jgi:hypothetical protein
MPDEQALRQEIEQYMWQDSTSDVVSEIGAEGIVESRYLDGMAVAVMIAPTLTGWSGVFQGSDTVQESFDGAGNGHKAMKCDSGGIYSLSVQKTTEGASEGRGMAGRRKAEGC